MSYRSKLAKFVDCGFRKIGGMESVGFTSSFASATTCESLSRIHRLGRRPVVITETSNRTRLRRFVSKEDYERAIFVSSLAKPWSSALQLEAELNRRHISLDNWINVNDATSAFYLAACKRLGVRASFLRAYENCRIKPLARYLTSSAGLCNTRFHVHDTQSSELPRSFHFPFIAKPIMGTASEAVRQIHGEKTWAQYLASARSSSIPAMGTFRRFSPGRHVLVEEILAGQECQIDGYIDEGRLRVCAIGVKWCDYGVNGYRELRGILYRPYSLPDAVGRDRHVVSWVKRLLKCLEFNSGTFHIEAKMNGPRIELIEINPRPGGGANVKAVKMLSGVDLNERCINLWLGVRGATRARTEASSLAFAVRYPKSVGAISYVRPPGRLETRTSTGSPLDWEPIAEEGASIDPDGPEQYLGVLLAPDFCRSLEDADRSTAELMRYVDGRKLIRERSNER